jgi:hypothetical protein
MFEQVKKKLSQFTKNYTPKIVTKLSKIWVWDPRSVIRKKKHSGSGSRGLKGTGVRSVYPSLIKKSLKGLSHDIDFKNFDKNLQNLA